MTAPTPTPRWSVAQIPDPHWYVAVVNPNCHAKAQDELSRLGYRAFKPELKKWVSHARVKKAVWRPILGRYLFVEVDPHEPLKGPIADLIEAQTGQRPNQNLGSVRNCNGIEGMVSVAGAPIMLPEGCVESLIRRQLEGEWDYVAKEDLPLGARVRVMEGEFADMLATLVSHRKGKCAVKILGTNITKTVYPVNLRAA